MTAGRPDYVTAAWAEIARRAQADHPGWAITHSTYGWTATRPAAPARTLTASSLPGLKAMIGAVERPVIPPAVTPGPGPAWPAP